MYIESISANNLTVIRAFDGSTLAAHNSGTAVHAFRTFTVTRGVNGTTAASHADNAAITRYVPPLDITQLAIAEAVATFHQERSGYGRSIGVGEQSVEFEGKALAGLRKTVYAQYRRVLEAAI
jgi:hypothetical protein